MRARSKSKTHAIRMGNKGLERERERDEMIALHCTSEGAMHCTWVYHRTDFFFFFSFFFFFHLSVARLIYLGLVVSSGLVLELRYGMGWDGMGWAERLAC